MQCATERVIQHELKQVGLEICPSVNIPWIVSRSTEVEGARVFEYREGGR